MQIKNSIFYDYVVDRQLDKQQKKWLQEKNTPSAVKKQQPAGEDMEERLKEKEACVQQLGITGERMKAEKGKLKNLLICLEISRRIAGGDKVPPADHRFLLKHDPALYARSIAMRFPKNNPYQYKRLSKDDECRNEWQIDIAAGIECLEGFMEGELPAQEAFGAAVDIKE